MQATTCFHDSVPHFILQKADFVFHDPVAFYPTNGVFNTDSDGGNTTINRFLRGREFSSRRFFLGLDDRDVMQTEALEALLLIQTGAKRKGIPSQLCQALIRGFPFRGVAQEAKVTRLSDHEEVFERVTRLLATVILLLLLGIFWAMDRAFGPLMPTRGTVEESSAGCVASIAVKASAIRAGSSS